MSNPNDPIKLLKSNKNNSDIAKALKNLRDNFTLILEQYTINAKLKRHYYEQLLEQKFTKEQALYIIKD